jgi:transposase-like protein
LKVVQDQGLKCPHCGELYNHRHCNIYPNGNQRCICGSCGKPFMRVKKNYSISEK